MTRAHSLASEPRLGELLDVDDVNLEKDTQVLLDRLAVARSEADRQRVELMVADSGDEQARLALEDGGLLPPPPVITEVCAALENEDITAWSGWDYLSHIADVTARREICARVPQLAMGVVLNDPRQVDRAKDLLTERSSLPTTFIAIGTTKSINDSEVRLAEGVDFVVPPNPALYDPKAAHVEKVAIQQRHTERQQRITAIDEHSQADHNLAHRLTTWREEYPPGSIAELRERAESTARELAAADSAVYLHGRELGQLTDRRIALQGKIPNLRATLRQAEGKARRLNELAERSHRIPEWTETADKTRASERCESARAEQARHEATRMRARAVEHQRAADSHRDTANRARAELGEVPGGDAVSDNEPEPAEPIETLRETFRSAMATYAKIEVDSDLRAELEQAEIAAARALKSFELLEPAVRNRAHQLLETPEGADAATRVAAHERAVREFGSLESECSTAMVTTERRRTELKTLPRPAECVDLPEKPGDISRGLQLVEDAKAEQSDAARKWEDLGAQYREAQRVLDDTRSSAEGFRLLSESITVPVSETENDPIYESDLKSAQEHHSSLRSALTSAEEAAVQADKRVREASDGLAQFSSGNRFEKLGTSVRKQIISVGRDELPEYAHQWADYLKPRLRMLEDDLAQIDRHRYGIVTRLHGMVDGALRTLRSAQRASRLPDGLDDWSGQEFLRIAYNPLDDHALVERLGSVVDETAVGRTPEGRPLKRDGMSLLLRGVLAAAPKGFRVDILKPDTVLRTERLRVSQIHTVFSGGQQLTAAILLYCTMAALRANNRGHMRNRHSGVLFLDNPIGTASAGYLLEIQRAVARALGVQLIYTTGLFDPNALSEFPLIIRLRNDADLRAHRKYLVVTDTVRPALDGLNRSDETARLSATRIFARRGAPNDDTTIPPGE